MKPLTRTDTFIIAFRFIFWITAWWVAAAYIEIYNDKTIKMAFACAVVVLALATRVLILEWDKANK